MPRGACPISPLAVLRFARSQGLEVTGSRGGHLILEHARSGQRMQLPRGGTWTHAVPWTSLKRLGDILGSSPTAVAEAVRRSRSCRRIRASEHDGKE